MQARHKAATQAVFTLSATQMGGLPLAREALTYAGFLVSSLKPPWPPWPSWPPRPPWMSRR